MTSMQPLRIGIFMDDFYPSSGGVGRSIELQTRELVAAGHDVVLFAPEVSFTPPNHCRYEALPAWALPSAASAFCSVKSNAQRAEAIATRYRFDIVHSQNERGSFILAHRVARLHGIPHVHTFHSNYAGTHATSPIAAAIYTLVFNRLVPRVVSRLHRDYPHIRLPRHLNSKENSRLAKHDWRSMAILARYTHAFSSPARFIIDNINDATYDQLRPRSFVIPNGINDMFRRARRIRPLDDTIRFLYVGRLDGEKRVDIVIEAFSRLPRRGAQLYIVGEGNEKARLEQLASKLEPRNSISFLGKFTEVERVANEMANADVFVFPSYRFDTQGMVLGEAASAGCAIIYCDDRLNVGVSEDNAVLTTPSVTGFEQAMHLLLSDTALLRQKQHHSRELAPRLTSEAMEHHFITMYWAAIESYYPQAADDKTP